MWLLQTLRWWLVVEIIGLLALPLTMRLLRCLPERGVTFRRPLGLLLGGVFYWLLVTFGALSNGPAGSAAAFLLVGGFSVAFGWRQRRLIGRELKRLRGYIALDTALFVLALVAWSYFRAHNPEIAATEKPMEFAFLNGILRSPTFPPRDPWLSGYGISYYYLGYVIMALLTWLSGLPSAVTFNLTGTLLFALTVSGSLGLVYNLVCAAGGADRFGVGRQGVSRAGAAFGLLGATLVAVMGNLVGTFELVRIRGWGTEALWQWLDVRNLGASPPSPTWYPQDTWWWWRASRVIHDRDLAGNTMEVISEFPFFSFLLGDNHPHVLALPFVLLAIALALNLLLGRGADLAIEGGETLRGLGSPSFMLQSRAGAALMGLWPGGFYEVLLWGVLLGAMAFLNTWDYPIYLGLFAAAFAIAHYSRRSPTRRWLAQVVQIGAILVLLSLLVYLPFYLGFRSQAGGLGLVSPFVKTQWQQFLLMFGVQIVLLAGFLPSVLARLWRGRGVSGLPWTARLWGAVLLFLMAGVALLGWYTAALGLFLLAVSGALLVWGVVAREQGSIEAPTAPTLMALLMAVLGLGLILSVEFVFLRDIFGTRMNTVFKFYYQGWILLSLSGAYGAFHVWRTMRRTGTAAQLAAYLWGALGAGLILAGLYYPLAATVSKADAFRGEPTLDGVRYVAQHRPDEYEAIQWLERHARLEAVMVEAPGGSYSAFNWISAHTGIPTLLGWSGHQLQWRGGYEVFGDREPAIDAIYTGRNANETLRLLQAYGVDYLIVGPMERQRYGAEQIAIDVLDQLMVPVFQNDRVLIYGRTW